MFTKQVPAAGSRPGTLAIPADSPRPKISIVQYDAERMDRRELASPEDLRGIEQEGRVTWVDIQGLGDEKTLRTIADVFGLHPLALEDAVNIPQRAKSQLYDQHQLVIARSPLVAAGGRIRTPQVCFVIGEHYLLTFQERYFGFFDPIRERIAAGNANIRNGGPDYLAYAMIDAMIDRYYPIVQKLSDQIGELEVVVLENPHPDVLTRIQLLRRQLAVIRRIGQPQREAIGTMLRDETPYFREATKVFLRDTHGHIEQIAELCDSSREMASDLADAFLSNVSYRSNEIMKVLTLMASIFIPLTFVAGIYGMNFDNMPELHSARGYFVVLGVMLVIAVGMLVFFYRKGWIGVARPPVLEEMEPEAKRGDDLGS